MAVTDLTDETFQETLDETEGITVVDFWAPWCGPCRIVGPVIEELADEYDVPEGEMPSDGLPPVRFAKLNTDEAQQTAAHFGIRSIPTIGFFRDGEAVGAVVGAYPKDALREVIEQVRAGKEQAGPQS